MATVHIDIGIQFSRVLGGRYKKDGPWSGEEFRETFLVPRMDEEADIVVELDNVAGFSFSFLEEAFGGLVREYGLERVQRRVQITTTRHQLWSDRAHQYMREAQQESNKRNKK